MVSYLYFKRAEMAAIDYKHYLSFTFQRVTFKIVTFQKIEIKDSDIICSRNVQELSEFGFSVIMSPCYAVSLSFCFLVILFPFNPVPLLFCFLVILFHCYLVVFILCFLVILFPCNSVSLSFCCFDRLFLCFSVFVSICCFDLPTWGQVARPEEVSYLDQLKHKLSTPIHPTMYNP